MRSKVEQIVLFLAGARQFRKILRRDDDVAGRTGHRPLARAFERLAIVLRDVEQQRPGFGLHLTVETADWLEKPNQRHAAKLRCASAAAAIVRQAETSSASPV